MTRKINSVSWLLVSMLAIARRIVLNIEYPCPHHLLVEWHFAFWSCHLRKEGRERLYQVEEPYWEVISSCAFLELAKPD